MKIKLYKMASVLFPVLETVKKQLTDKVFDFTLDRVKSEFRKVLHQQIVLYLNTLLILTAAALPTYFNWVPNPIGIYLSAIVWQAILLFFTIRLFKRIKDLFRFFKAHPDVLKKGRKTDDLIVLILASKYKFFPKIVNYYVDKKWLKKTVNFIFPVSKLLKALKIQALKELTLFVGLILIYELLIQGLIMPVLILDPNHMTRWQWYIFPLKIFF